MGIDGYKMLAWIIFIFVYGCFILIGIRFFFYRKVIREIIRTVEIMKENNISFEELFEEKKEEEKENIEISRFELMDI